MSGINGQTEIRMTATQLLSGIALLSAAAFAVAHFTFGGLKDDVSDIRKAVTETQDRNANTHQAATTADGELRAQIAGLTAELRVTNASLAELTNSVGGLDDSMKAVDARLASSVDRQISFERWVVTRLGDGGGPIPTSIPFEWQKAEGEIINTLTAGDEPLSGWFKAVSER